MSDARTSSSEEAIRLRSYLLWQSEGCPDGDALNFWLRAKVELEAEQSAGRPLRTPSAFVMPRLPISPRPSKRIATRLKPNRFRG
jgi:hypothetical protein